MTRTDIVSGWLVMRRMMPLLHGLRRLARSTRTICEGIGLSLLLSSGRRRRALAARNIRTRRENAGKHILDENEIIDGIDELGVLLFGHDNNAY